MKTKHRLVNGWSRRRRARGAAVVSLAAALCATSALGQSAGPGAGGAAAGGSAVAAAGAEAGIMGARVRAARAAADAVETARLIEVVSALPPSRSPFGDADALVRTEALLVERLRGLGFEPVVEPINWARREHEGRYTWNNLYVEIPGRVRPEEVIIIGAHFDSVPRTPGADDNGTGVAAVLELARILRDRPAERTVRLVLFNLEEIGLIGAAHHAGELAPRIASGEIRAVGMASLDMLGFFSDEPGSQKLPPLPDHPLLRNLRPPTTADFIGMGGVLGHREGWNKPFDEAMRRHAPGLKSFVLDHLPVAPPDLLRSDHAPFLAIGVPSFILSDTANFRSPHYHQPTDTLDTLDVERFALTVRGIVGATYELAGPIVDGTGSDDPAPEPEPAASPAPTGRPGE